MSLSMKINPVEIPELLHIIGCHLSLGDQKICMLVSRTWYSLFKAYYWHHLNYSRHGIPHLEQQGHLVRWVTTYWASNQDLNTIAGSCHFVQRIDLELGTSTDEASLEILMGNLPHIQEMTFRMPHCFGLKHLVTLTRLKRLRRLRLGSSTGYQRSTCNFSALLNVLQDCSSLSSLQLEGLDDIPELYAPPPPWQAIADAPSTPSPNSTESFQDTTSMCPSSTHSHPPTAAQRALSAQHRQALSSIQAGMARWNDPATPPSRVDRWLQRFLPRLPADANPTRPSAAQRLREPWRKFVCDNTIKIPTKIPKELLTRQPDSSEIFPKLTRLHLSISTTTTTTPIWLLFKKAPYLQSLHLDFGGLTREHTARCLNAITETCFLLQTLAFEKLTCSYETNNAIDRFFRQHRPSFLDFKLKQCFNIEHVLALIPSATAGALERVCFDSSITSHPVLHHFMTRCLSLQYLTWTTNILTADPLPPPEQRLESFLEPWGCYETMRHVEQNNCICDQGSLDAFYGRLAQMARLVSVGMSLDDVRRTVARDPRKQTASETLKQEDRQAQELEDQPVQNQDVSSLLESRMVDGPLEPYSAFVHEIGDHFEGCSALKSVQELTLGPIRVISHTSGLSLLLSPQLKATNMRCILTAFPKLRKIRYRGSVFPLDEGARKYIEDMQERRISVIHVSQ